MQYRQTGPNIERWLKEHLYKIPCTWLHFQVDVRILHSGWVIWVALALLTKHLGLAQIRLLHSVLENIFLILKDFLVEPFAW